MKFTRGLFLFFAIIICCFTSYAQPAFSETESLQSYLDGIIESRMKDNHIPGATLVLVKDSMVMLKKGYGFADLDQEIKVDPDKTLFRVGSISKLFVWTAIMQLYEDDMLDLEDDINKYLDIDFPGSYDEPITIKDLMNHTSGFEDYILGLFGKEASSIRPLEDILNKQVPARVMPPGRYVAYSNHGAGMAARIVEVVSGMKWNKYAEKYIIQRLGMKRTTFEQPVPDHWKGNLATGYSYENNEFKPHGFEYVPMSGAGGASSTASDMARFMLAFLRPGSQGMSSILDSTTFMLMREKSFQNHPKVNPMRYGFLDISRNGKTIIGHAGDTFWFHSLMALFPEEDLGIFLSFNGQNGALAYLKFLEDFVDRYFPEELPQVNMVNSDELKPFEGIYGSIRYPHSRLTKISRLGSTLNISVTDSGLLKSHNAFLGETEHWFQLDDLVFQNTRSSDVIVFEKGENGTISHLLIGNLPVFVYERLRGMESPSLHSSIFLMIFFIILITMIFWPTAFFARKGYSRKHYIYGSLPTPAKFLAWINGFILLMFLVGMVLILRNPLEIAYGVPGLLKILLGLPVLFATLTVVMVFFVIAVWRAREIRFWSRIYFTFVWIVFVMAIWQLNYWNLLGWRY